MKRAIGSTIKYNRHKVNMQLTYTWRLLTREHCRHYFRAGPPGFGGEADFGQGRQPDELGRANRT